MSDPPLKKCPKCGKKKLRRLFGAGAAIIFKGSGFYQTDYRSESYKSGAQADQASSNTGSTDKTASNGTAKDSSNGKTGESSKPSEKKAKSTS
jgi:predicted nucleic acid-binding Zn ribbon protein